MTEDELLKALGLTKKSCLSELIVQTTHHWLEACDNIAELKEKNKALELYADLADAKVDEVRNKLSEAKEIIRELLLSDTRKGSDWTGYLVDLKERAEASLKEEENDNN